MALADFARAWSLVRRVESLLQLQTDVRQALQAVDERLRALEDRMLRLESEQVQIVTEARSAATAVAASIAGGVIADAVTRVTKLEGRTERLEQSRLAPP